MCPLGSGAIDYPAVRAFLDKRGYQGWITIEQERDPRNVEAACRRSRKACATCARLVF